jgi:ActR/RegA family two-component response regulator
MGSDPTKGQAAPAPARSRRELGWRSLVAGLPPSGSSALATALWPSLERIQWEYIHAVLESCNGNISEAARQLGVHRQSLQRMLRRLPPRR